MWLAEDAALPAIAAQFACTIFFGDVERAARQFASLPQTLIFEKEAKKAGITIDIAKELVRLNSVLAPAKREQPRFLVIKHAELLNENASNALLKTLEEAQQRFVLLARPGAVILPTILSRAAVFYLPCATEVSAETEQIATISSVPQLANTLDKQPERALAVLNARAQRYPEQIEQINAAARAILAGNGVRLALLTYL